MSRILLFLILTCASISGCAVAQAHRDQDQMRTALLDLYTDQVMDNLIRAHQRMPIIQLDYTQAQGMITLQSSASLSDAFTTTAPVANSLTSMLGLTNTNQITINAVPVTTSNEVYDAYLEFLSIPDSLITTSNPPPDGAAHICRKCGCLYYWVPVTCSDQFFRLSLLTTAQRGQTLLNADTFYTVNVLRYDPTSVVNRKLGGVLVTLELDKKIPNDSGFLKFPDGAPGASFANTSRHIGPGNDKRIIQAAYQEPPPPIQAEPAPSPDPVMQQDFPFAKFTDPETGRSPGMTNRIEIVYTGDLGALESSLPKTAKVYLSHYQPRSPSTEDLLQRTNFQLQQLNQNAVRTGKP